MAGRVLKEKKLLVIFLLVGAIVGVIVALSTPKYYTSEVEMAPEFSSGGISLAGGLSDFAASFGVDLGSGGQVDAIYPDLYPDVVVSTDFLRSLYDIPVRLVDDNEARPYLFHILKEWHIPFWFYPQIWFAELKAKWTTADTLAGEGVDNYRVSKKDWENIKTLRQSIVCLVDRKSSVITISVTDQDPVTAAIVADTICGRLQSYITSYRTNKARLDVESYQALSDEAKCRYDSVRQKYVDFMDSNLSVSRMASRVKGEDLENEMQVYYSIYTQTLAMLHQAQVKLQERTPAFTVIQQPVTPHKPSSVPRIFIVLVWIIIAGMADSAWVLFIRDWMQSRKQSNQ